MSRRFRLAVPLQTGDRVLALYGRHLTPGGLLELDVYYDEVLWDQITIRQPGDFMAPLELPESAGNGQLAIKIESRRVTRLPREFRGVSFLLDDVLLLNRGPSGDRWRRASGFRPRREALARQPDAAAV